MEKRHLQMVCSFLLASTMTACGGGGSGSLPAMTNANIAGQSSLNSSTLHTASFVSSATPTYMAIDAGSTSAVGSWAADKDHLSVGNWGVVTTSNSIDTSHVSNPAPQAVYKTQRYATHLTYTIPGLAPSGAYTVRLHFAESFFSSAAKRVFNAAINGTKVLSNLDIFQSAGGSNVAIVKQFPVVADAAGTITIKLDASTNNASICGIDISGAVAVAPPTPIPTPTASPNSAAMINAGGGASSNGWVADTDYQTAGWTGTSTATASINSSRVTNPAPQSVYQSQRYGGIVQYIIPRLSPNAAYTVRLHFAEAFWNAVGKRVFNIAINGTPVLGGFDIYKTAGGPNTAIVEQFATHADGSGNVSIVMTATTDYASVSGVQITAGGSSASPTPTPIATPTPVASPTPLPSPSPISQPGKYPLYSSYFTGSTPFHATASYLKSLSGTVQLSSATVQNYWNQTWWNNVPSHPINFANPHNNSFKMSCTTWGACNANGRTTWFASGNPVIEGASDGHITSVDPQSGSETDCWQGSISGSALHCSWGGYYPLSGDGLAHDGTSSATGAGFAVGIFTLNAQDMIDGLNGTPIKHALGATARCLDNLPNGRMAWPAFTNKGSDSTCTGNHGGPSGNQPAYGDLFVLNMTSAQIAGTSYSPACKVILNALATYGLYLMDTGGGNDNIWVEDPRTYGSSNNPWYNTIEPQFGSDGNGQPGAHFSFKNCTNRLSASNFSMYEIQSGSGR